MSNNNKDFDESKVNMFDEWCCFTGEGTIDESIFKKIVPPVQTIRSTMFGTNITKKFINDDMDPRAVCEVKKDMCSILKAWLRNRRHFILPDGDYRVCMFEGRSPATFRISDNGKKTTLLAASGDLCGCDFSDLDLSGIDFSFLNLNGCNFRRSNLSNCDFSNAYLKGADLELARLKGCIFTGAHVEGANFSDGALAACAVAPDIPLVCPETGSFIGWKKANMRYGDEVRPVLVKLEILPESKRSSGASERKCRCSKAKVLAAWTDPDELDHSPLDKYKHEAYTIELKHGDRIFSEYDSSFYYTVGDIITPIGNSFDENRWNICAPGIHFFMTKAEAAAY